MKKRKKKKPGKNYYHYDDKQKKPKPAPSQCRDCGERRTVPRFIYFKAKRVRCLKCGGQMEYLPWAPKNEPAH